MEAKDILARHFEKTTSDGYRAAEVDEFLRELSGEFAKLQRENSELQRKLGILADKICEYRDEEAALKEVLLMTEKQGSRIISIAALNSLMRKED